MEIRTGVIGAETLKIDFENQIKSIRAQFPVALRNVGAEMENSLRRHIQTDVYDAYTPISYPRRKYHPNFGTPLDGDSNTDIWVSGDVLAFTYFPSGTHSGTMSDTLNYNDLTNKPQADAPLKPNPANGDELINRIETAEGYDWQPKKPNKPIPPRPFFENFLKEAERSTIIEAFLVGMKPFDVRASGKDVIFDGSEYDYQKDRYQIPF